MLAVTPRHTRAELLLAVDGVLFAATPACVLQSRCSVSSSSVHTLTDLSMRVHQLSYIWSVCCIFSGWEFAFTTQSVRQGGSCSVTLHCVADCVCLANIKSNCGIFLAYDRHLRWLQLFWHWSIVSNTLVSFIVLLCTAVYGCILEFRIWSMVYAELWFRRVGLWLNLWTRNIKKCEFCRDSEPHCPPPLLMPHHLVCAYEKGQAFEIAK